MTACSPASDGTTSSAEAPLTGLRDDDAGHADPPAKDTDRVRNHGGRVLSRMNLRIVYFGAEDEDGAPSRDELVAWTIQSGNGYWDILAQYNVFGGVLRGSQRVDRNLVIPESAVDDGIIEIHDLEDRIREFLHPEGEASPVPSADAYLFFLPDGVNVALSTRGTKVFTTCVDVGAYHRFDGVEPYAVFPPCALGHSPRAISHELAEMATDPIVGTGWISDRDDEPGIGEIADLCNREVDPPINGYAVTELWSDRDGQCFPLVK